MKTILIVDDDTCINDLLFEILTKAGYKVFRAWSGTEAKMLLEKERIDLVLLDLMLPGINGEDLLSQFKELPIIVLSAKSGIDDKINLLSGGAVDYITKPFDKRELLARIDVQLRKQNPNANLRYEYREISVDTVSHSARVNGNDVLLTKTEYALLKLLIQNPEKVLSKSYILEAISYDTPDCTEDSLKQHISNLRRKIKAFSPCDYIESVWGIGFVLK